MANELTTEFNRNPSLFHNPTPFYQNRKTSSCLGALISEIIITIYSQTSELIESCINR